MKGVQPDEQTYATLINACARVNNSKKAIEYFNEMIRFVYLSVFVFVSVPLFQFDFLLTSLSLSPFSLLLGKESNQTLFPLIAL